MNGALEARIKPFESPAARDFSDATVKDPNEIQSESNSKDKVNFRDLLLNSNDETARERVAQKNGDNLRAAKSDEEFAKMMREKSNPEKLRKPQNELDKDAFLKLFVTQMRNQDPLNPDDSSEMAAQLAQFHGLEQMMNVNKNLEKMQSDEAVGRAVNLINFVGKEVKLNNGKLQIENGRMITDASVRIDQDSINTSLEIRDTAGVVVAQKDLGPLQAGDNKLEWEGLSKDGKKLSNGAYTFNIVASDRNNQPIPTTITSTLQVTGVDLHDVGGAFHTPIGKVAVRDVASVGTSQSHSDQAKRSGAKKADPAESLKTPEPAKPTAPRTDAKPLMEMPLNFGAKGIPVDKKPAEKAGDKVGDRGNDKASLKKEA
ncbi:MAG: hypothetical protein RL011_378 [Pseudomonadota bacterium]